MTQDRLIIGMPGNLALWRLLNLKGIHLPLQALEETLLWDFSLEAMLQDLRVRNLPARGVFTAAQDLTHLPLPTLAQVQTGDWVVLLRRERGGLVLEQGVDGEEWFQEADLAPFLTGLALELSEPLPKLGGFWSRVGGALFLSRPAILRVILASLLLQALALVGPWATRLAVDSALPTGALSTLGVLALGLVLAQVFRSVTGIVRDYAMASLGSRFDAAMQTGLMEQFLALPFRKLQALRSGAITQAFSAVDSARRVLLTSGATAVLSTATSVVYLIWMFALMPGMAGVVTFAGISLGLASLVFARFLAQSRTEQVAALQASQTALSETIRGIQTLKAAALESWAERRWHQRLNASIGATLRLERGDLAYGLVSEMLIQGTAASLLVWGATEVLAGSLTLGSLLAFTQLATIFLAEVGALAQQVLSFQAWRPALVTVEDLLTTERRQVPPRKGVIFEASPVVVQDLWFRYAPDRPWIAQGVSLSVPAGGFHHLPGPSGSGKSTLLRILAGLYQPERGSISIGGHDPVLAAPTMAYLPQFPSLMSGTIQQNLRLFSQSAPRSLVMEAAAETGLADWVATLPMGYGTVVVSGGQNLSGGQRQLIALTGVLASKKRVLLLDEALSNLDWVSRRRIIEGPLLKGRTVIYASHEEVFRHSG